MASEEATGALFWRGPDFDADSAYAFPPLPPVGPEGTTAPVPAALEEKKKKKKNRGDPPPTERPRRTEPKGKGKAKRTEATACPTCITAQPKLYICVSQTKRLRVDPAGDNAWIVRIK